MACSKGWRAGFVTTSKRCSVLAGHRPASITVLGGTVRLEVLSRIKANVLNLPVMIPDLAEAAATGAALLAGIGSGRFDDPKRAAASLEYDRLVIDPDVQAADWYDSLYHSAYRPLDAALQGVNQSRCAWKGPRRARAAPAHEGSTHWLLTNLPWKRSVGCDRSRPPGRLRYPGARLPRSRSAGCLASRRVRRTSTKIRDFKTLIVECLARHASATLLDPQYSAGQLVASGAIPGDRGLIVASESGYSLAPGARATTWRQAGRQAPSSVWALLRSSSWSTTIRMPASSPSARSSWSHRSSPRRAPQISPCWSSQ